MTGATVPDFMWASERKPRAIPLVTGVAVWKRKSSLSLRVCWGCAEMARRVAGAAGAAAGLVDAGGGDRISPVCAPLADTLTSLSVPCDIDGRVSQSWPRWLGWGSTEPCP